MPSLREATFSVCKHVMKSPNRIAVQHVLESLDRCPGEPFGPDDRSQFGSLARQQFLQVVGYLLVDRTRDVAHMTMPFPFPIPEITTEERETLSEAAGDSLCLNRNCISKTEGAGPAESLADTLDPYSLAMTSLGSIPEVPFLMNERDHRVIAAAYEQNKALEAAKNGWAIVSGAPPEAGLRLENMSEEVSKMRDVLYSSGALAFPEQLQALVRERPAADLVRHYFRFLAALVCLRESLSCVDQLVYQATRSDRLFVVDSDNLLAIDHNTHHYGGHGLAVTVLPDGRRGTADAGEIIVVQLPWPDEPRYFAKVQMVQFRGSRETGNEVRYEMRVLDDDLNPLGHVYELL